MYDQADDQPFKLFAKLKESDVKNSKKDIIKSNFIIREQLGYTKNRFSRIFLNLYEKRYFYH